MLQSVKFSQIFPTGEYFPILFLHPTLVSKVTSNYEGPTYSLWLDFPLIFIIIKKQLER